MTHTTFNTKSAKQLEDLFFSQQDEILIKKLKELEHKKKTIQSLAEVSGIQNTAVLEKLVQIGINPETMSALTAIPLIEIAWADGTLDDKEARAIMEILDTMGIDANNPSRTFIDHWIKVRPQPELFATWQNYAHEVAKAMPKEQREQLKAEILERAKKIAIASAKTFLGIGSKINKEEERVLKKIEKVFKI